MIGVFEGVARLHPQRTCFTFVDDKGVGESYSYRETRMLSAGLARLLARRGVRRGGSVAVDVSNRPICVFLLLAAAYGGFTLVMLNNRLTDAEKSSRLLDLGRSSVTPAFTVTDDKAHRLMEEVIEDLTGATSSQSTIAPATSPRDRRQGRSRSGRTSFAGVTVRSSMASASARSTRALGRAASGRASVRRRDEMAQQEAIESVMHFAERGSHLFDFDARAIVMFTSGTTGRAKAVPLTWKNLCRSAEVSNSVLNRRGEGLWQVALPMYHVGGLQMVVRSVLNANSFILYSRFDADRILADAARKGATHISVVDKALQDMLASPRSRDLKRYDCVLLGGGPLNAQTLSRALASGVRVYASYGMTETSSQIANMLVEEGFSGGMRLLPGYEARIVDAGPDGFGRLAVRGPGLFDGYLNARAAYTADGFFLTGDVAAAHEGLLYVRERTGDMFVSGGENVYPAEIRQKLISQPGVADAYVFGVPDPVWGRRPVAFVERSPQSAAVDGSSRSSSSPAQRRLDGMAFAASVKKSLSSRLSKLYRPKRLYALDSFPRTGIGKVDRAALEQLHEQRLEIVKVNLYRIRVPFKQPFRTAKGTLSERESVLVEVVDHAGRTGLGECVAFTTDWYLPETLDQDVRALRELIVPALLNRPFLHPSEVDALLSAAPGAAACPLARGAIEPAMWDLYGKIVGKPLWRLIGGGDQPGASVGMAVPDQGKEPMRGAKASVAVPAGAVVPIGSVEETLATVGRCVAAGYARIKLKVSPGNAVECLRAVRKAYPDLMISLDANQSFTEADLEELKQIDGFDPVWIEEPLDPRRVPQHGPRDIFARLAALQGSLRTRVCIDESVTCPADLSRALQHPQLACYALKIAKLGGVQPALEFLRIADRRGISVWMGGMYDTGISRRVHAAFETLPQVIAPGDIGSVSRYFDVDVTEPPYAAARGNIILNGRGHESGIGCSLNRAALDWVLVDRITLE